MDDKRRDRYNEGCGVWQRVLKAANAIVQWYSVACRQLTDAECLTARHSKRVRRWAAAGTQNFMSHANQPRLADVECASP